MKAKLIVYIFFIIAIFAITSITIFSMMFTFQLKGNYMYCTPTIVILLGIFFIKSLQIAIYKLIDYLDKYSQIV